MKLWLLEPALSRADRVAAVKALPVDTHPKTADPWHDRDGLHYLFIIRADTEESARNLASKRANKHTAALWLDCKQTTCKQLTSRGKEGIIRGAYRAVGSETKELP